MNQDLTVALVRMVLSLGIVLVLALILLRWVLPKLTGLPAGDRAGIEILGIRPLDRQNKLAVVRAEGRRFLLAFGPGGITSLSSRAETVGRDDTDRAAAPDRLVAPDRLDSSDIGERS